MSVVFTDAFVVAADTFIKDYPATPNYAYNVGATGDLTVNAVNDRVQATTEGTNWVARITNAAVPTGNQKILADCYVVDSVSNAGGQLAARCNSSGSADFYMVKMNPSDDTIKLYRCDAAAFTLLSSVAMTITGDGVRAAFFSAVGVGATVDLVADFAGTQNTYSDTHANRKTSGPPGVSVWSNGGNTGNVYVDNVSVDNLLSLITQRHGNRPAPFKPGSARSRGRF